ncbi:MAG: hypothetical protein Q4E69_05200 [Bacilli bacterium]|nr:hypothetical protein [Bacilli bacterium]
MSKKFKLLALLMTLSITMCIMSNTYSKYAADTTGNLEVTFAKWQILVNTTDITDGVSRTLTITPTIDTNANVAANKIAPASTGYFDIEVDPSNAEVSFNYTITLSGDNNIPDVKMTKYAILDENYTPGDTIEKTNITNNQITGTQNYSAGGFDPFTIRVYFEWIEGNGESMDDDDDTAIGHAATNQATDSMEMTASIHFEQKIS